MSGAEATDASEPYKSVQFLSLLGADIADTAYGKNGLRSAGVRVQLAQWPGGIQVVRLQSLGPCEC